MTAKPQLVAIHATIKEVAFVAISVSDKERARIFYQETLELQPTLTQMDDAWIEYDIAQTTIGVGCHPAWQPREREPRWHLRWMILTRRWRS